MPINVEWLLRIEREQRRNRVFRGLSETYVSGEGGNDPIAFIVGEAPGAMEETIGRPFVGPSGQVLRKLMAGAGLWATNTYDSKLLEIAPTTDGVIPANCWLTNVLKFRPPGNRTPTPIEIRACRPYLRKEWNAVGSPTLVIVIGATAYRAITGKVRSILLESGKPHSFISSGGSEVTLWPMIHPSFGLRNRHVRSLIEADWEILTAWMEQQ